jgi:predicted nucleic acid-binding protein
VTPSDVPSGPVLVDTDVVSCLIWAKLRHQEWAGLVRGRLLALSFATIGELRSGAISAGWGVPKRAILEDRIARFVPVPGRDSVVDEFAKIHARFRRQFEHNDMWTVACSLAQPSPLPIATANVHHFKPMADTFGFVLVHPDL